MITSATSFVPAPPNSDEKPFEIKDEITVFDGAMVYSGRHPCPRFLNDASVPEHLEFLRAGIPQLSKSRLRARARQSWDILREIIVRIEQKKIHPSRRAFDNLGQLDPVRTRIRTSVLADLAIERSDRPKYLRYLTDKLLDRPQPPPFTQKGAEQFATKYIAEEKTAGRRPTLAGLEGAARQANRRGGRDFLRRAFRQIQGPAKRGRPPNA
jgi:hypothetical protein